jgi:hypothetical protein
MLLLVYYVIFMLLANVVTYFDGLVVERWWGSQASLVVFFGRYLG